MSPRKRREPPSPISPRRSPKRLRAPPAPWNHSEKAANPSTGSVGAACRYTAGGPYYGIKAILDERDGKYLVDWSDDLNGITYEPDWVSILSVSILHEPVRIRVALYEKMFLERAVVLLMPPLHHGALNPVLPNPLIKPQYRSNPKGI